MCAVYSVVNALRLAAARHTLFSQGTTRRLFKLGADHLGSKDLLMLAMTEGVQNRRWRALAQKLAEAASRPDMEFVIERPDRSHWSSVEDAFAWIEESIRDEKPVLIPLLDGIDHFSVVSGVTPSTLQLFDSIGISFIRKSSCGFAARYHRIPPKHLMRIAVRQRP